MKTKLTLSMEQDLVLYARRQASRRGQTISGIFSEFLRRQQRQTARRMTASVADMAGSLQQYPIDDTKQQIRTGYAEKYLD